MGPLAEGSDGHQLGVCQGWSRVQGSMICARSTERPNPTGWALPAKSGSQSGLSPAWQSMRWATLARVIEGERDRPPRAVLGTDPPSDPVTLSPLGTVASAGLWEGLASSSSGS